MEYYTAFLNAPLKNIIRPGKTQGDKFGIEVELEGRNVRSQGSVEEAKVFLLWKETRDGSLRENHGQAVEWVQRQPLVLKKTTDAVNLLYSVLKNNGAQIVPSNRCSVHVHFNMSDKKVYQLYNLYILFTIFEDLLQRFCGEERQGNLNCLTSREARDLVQVVEDSLFKWQNFNDFGEEMRYAAFNFSSLHKFGSVEFRGMRGLDNAEDVNTWLDILNELISFACYEMGNPDNLLKDISFLSPYEFSGKVFSQKNLNLLCRDLPPAVVKSSLYEGLRTVQHLCYNIGKTWEDIDIVVKKPDAADAEDWWANVAAPVEPEPLNAVQRLRDLEQQRRAVARQPRVRNKQRLILDDFILREGDPNDLV